MYGTLRQIKNNKMRNKDKLDFINQIVEETEKQCDTLVVSNQRELLQYFCELTNITHDTVNQDIEDTIHKFNAL